jgi:outer membrane protein insertion porin family
MDGTPKSSSKLTIIYPGATKSRLKQSLGVDCVIPFTEVDFQTLDDVQRRNLSVSLGRQREEQNQRMRLFASLLTITILSAGPASILAQGVAGDPEIEKELAELSGPEPKAKVIVAVEVTGNRRVASDDIRINIASRPGMTYDEARIAEDIRALYRIGFFSDIKVDRKDRDDGVALIYTVTEKPAINEVKYEGNDEIDTDDIKEVVDLESNKPLDVPTIHRNLQKIRDLYSEKGFFLSLINYKLEKKGENTYDVIFVINEHAQVEVKRISFVGNRELSDAAISRYLSTRTGGPLSFLTSSGKFTKEQFERDMTVISAVYWDHGYLDVKVGTPRVELSADRRYIFLSVPIEEGPRYRVGRVKVVEHDANNAEVALLGGRRIVRSMAMTQRGSWFSRTSVMDDVNRITRYYQDKGYAHANVNLATPTNPKTRIVDLVFDISRGPMVYFERVDIRGNTKTKDRVIRREVVIHEGERYSKTGIEASKARVTQLGFFETVDITENPGSTDDKISLTVEVTEKHTGQFQIGMGISSVEKFIGQAQVSEQNFLGHGQTLSLQIQMSSMRQIFMGNFWEPYFLNTEWTFAFSIFNTVMNQTDYNKKSTGGDLTLGHSVGMRDLKLYLTYALSYDQVDTGSNSGILIAGGRKLNSGFNDMPLAYLFEEGFLSSVQAKLAFDKRNNRLFPTQGSYNMISVEWATPYLGSDFSFTRYSLSSRWYIPLFWKLVFRLQGNFGIIYSNDSTNLAIVHRYRSGGIMDVRGFYPWSLGPHISTSPSMDPNRPPIYGGTNIGGNMRITLNSEIEFPIVEMMGIKGVVFFDAGNSFNLEDTWCQAGTGAGITKFTDPCNHNPLYLRTSAGFGFRWFSPMGPLRFEWGWPTQTYGHEDKYMFEFTFGNFF